MMPIADIMVSVSLAIILNSAEKNEKAEKKNYVLLQHPFCISNWAFPIPVN